MEGIYVASVTPFDKENKINEEALKMLMNMNLKQGAAGFFIGGSSAENFLMTSEERIKTFEIASSFLDKTDMFAQVGSISTDQSIYFAKAARELGFKKIAAIPPFYFGFNQKEIAQYYYDISNAVDMPVLYYNIPTNTHKEMDLTNEDMVSVLKSGAISGIKHTNLDIYQMERIKSINNKLICYGGFEQCMVAFMAMGCDGFIGSTFNFMLPHYKKIYDLFNDGKLKEARELQVKANNIMEVICSAGLFPSIKYILSKQGIDAGTTRKPFLNLTEDGKNKVDDVLKKNLCN